MAPGPPSAPERAKESMGVGSGENVFVSCIIIATTNFLRHRSFPKPLTP